MVQRVNPSNLLTVKVGEREQFTDQMKKAKKLS